MLHYTSRATCLFAGLAFTLVAIGCSAGNGDDGSGGSGSGASTSTFGNGGDTTSFGNGGDSSVGGGCVADPHVAQKVPLDMYIMLDQSGSMGDPPSSGSGTKWGAVTAALSAFVNQGASDISVGIQYFPIPSGVSCPVFPVQCTSDADCSAGCGPCDMPIPGFGICSGVGNSDSCVAGDYAMPDVEIAALPGNASAINSSISNHGPTGGTPTLPASGRDRSHSGVGELAPRTRGDRGARDRRRSRIV